MSTAPIATSGLDVEHLRELLQPPGGWRALCGTLSLEGSTDVFTPGLQRTDTALAQALDVLQDAHAAGVAVPLTVWWDALMAAEEFRSRAPWSGAQTGTDAPWGSAPQIAGALSRWRCDLDVWDALLGSLQMGGASWRILSKSAAACGHAPSVVHRAVLYGHTADPGGGWTPSTVLRAVERLDAMDVRVRVVAGGLADGWIGTLDELVDVAASTTAAPVRLEPAHARRPEGSVRVVCVG